MTYTLVTTTPYPIYEIHLQLLNDPVDISDIFAICHIRDYVYTFEYLGTVIKYGLSFDNRTTVPGERVYRQAGHLEGWSKKLTGPNGNEMEKISEEYRKKTGSPLNYKGMKIIVHDLTQVESPSISDPYLHVKKLEHQLIKDYQDNNGQLPIGNIKDESYLDRTSYVGVDTWNTLFSDS